MLKPDPVEVEHSFFPFGMAERIGFNLIGTDIDIARCLSYTVRNTAFPLDSASEATYTL